GRIAGGRRILGGGKRSLLQLDGLSVAVQVSDAPGTLGQMLLELGPLCGRQVAAQVLVQKLGEFAAVHASPRRNAGPEESGFLMPGVSGWRRPAPGSGGPAFSPLATMSLVGQGGDLPSALMPVSGCGYRGRVAG